MIILIMLLIMAIFADVIADYETVAIKPNYDNINAAPSRDHIFGCDELGRDIFARIVHGSRYSLSVGLVSVGIALLFGTITGAIAGFYGGRLDNLIMRFMDIILAIPSIVLAIAIVSALGTSLINLMIAIGISNVPRFARIVRSSVLSIKDQEFIEASRAIGETNTAIIFKEVLPNCLAPIIVQVTLSVATAILSASSLSFIGMGIQPPAPEWGNMLSGGRSFMRDAPHLCIIPGIFIMITILSLNLLGDGLRDALDPKQKR